MKSALSTKVLDDSMIVVDAITARRTTRQRQLLTCLRLLALTVRLLSLLDSVDEKVVKSAANIPGVKTAACQHS